MTKNIISAVSGKEVTSSVNAALPLTPSATGKELEAIIARYKVSNPVKWASKKAETQDALKKPNL